MRRRDSRNYSGKTNDLMRVRNGDACPLSRSDPVKNDTSAIKCISEHVLP